MKTQGANTWTEKVQFGYFLKTTKILRANDDLGMVISNKEYTLC